MRFPLPHLLLLLLLAAGTALAAPLPRLGPDSLPSGVALPVTSEPRTGACGTNLQATFDALAAAAARPAVDALATSHSADLGGIAVLENDGTFLYTDRDGHLLMDLASVGQTFYRTHGDDYDFLAVYLASGPLLWLGSPGALASAAILRNDTQGIGLPQIDAGAAVGSASRLQVMLSMNSLSRYPADPEAVVASGDVFNTMGVLAHEFAHRWLAYTMVDSAGTPSTALLGRDLQHWNFFFDSDSSYMEGCDWTAVRPDSFVTTGITSTFGALDQYLIGLKPRSEMAPFFTVNAPEAIVPPGPYSPTSVPAVGVGCRGRATNWTLADLERQNGTRLPDAASAPHRWRVAFVLLVPNGSAASDSDLAKLQQIRTLFPGVIAAATSGRGSVDVSLDSRAGEVRIAHVPLKDTEDAGAPRLVGLRAWIEQGGVPLALDPASVTLHWRFGSSGPFAAATCASAGADSFAIALPVPTSGGRVQYWLSAASDSAGIAAQLPAGGPATPFEFSVGPDLQPPLLRHVPVSFQGFDRMPAVVLARVTDNLGVDSVWCEASVDGGPVLPVPVTVAGADSFAASIGAGLSAGHAVAYRFGARDASLARNVGFSRAAFDTLRVVHDWFDDFENPAPAYFHAPVLWSGRDAWHLDAADGAPAGGTAWRCGGTGSTPYAPHLDAALYLPWMYGIVPGTVLLFDERHSLEQLDGAYAFDGARVEWQVASGPWLPVEPQPGYTHTVVGSGPFLPNGARVWSGESQGWITHALDLTPLAPGPVRVRIRMSTDDLFGAGGLWVDRVRLRYPDDAGVGVPLAPLSTAVGPAWPNPTRGALRVRLSLARGARVEWSLLDVQGRKVATLWNGAAEAGPRELAGQAPASLAPGLYFTRLVVDGHVLDRRRVAIVR